jgi:hypothetical protein
VGFAVDKCLRADIPSVLNGSFVAIRPSLRMSGFGAEPNGSIWRLADMPYEGAPKVVAYPAAGWPTLRVPAAAGLVGSIKKRTGM